MNRVEMTHPTLPPGQTIRVGEQAVPHHVAAGWQVADEPTLEAAVDLEKHDTGPRRRRRRNDAGTPAGVDTEAGTEPAANATEGDVTP